MVSFTWSASINGQEFIMSTAVGIITTAASVWLGILVGRAQERRALGRELAAARAEALRRDGETGRFWSEGILNHQRAPMGGLNPATGYSRNWFEPDEWLDAMLSNIRGIALHTPQSQSEMLRYAERAVRKAHGRLDEGRYVLDESGQVAELEQILDLPQRVITLYRQGLIEADWMRPYSG